MPSKSVAPGSPLLDGDLEASVEPSPSRKVV